MRNGPMQEDENEYLKQYAKGKGLATIRDVGTYLAGVFIAGMIIIPETTIGYIVMFILGIPLMWVVRWAILRIFY